MNCCLCESKEVRKLETIDRKILLSLYYKLTKTDFSYLLNREITYCECNVCKLKFFDPLIAGDEKFYNSLQKYDWYYPSEKEEYIIAKKYIKQSDKVLEVGSGKGAFAKKLKLKNYIGLDFSLNAKKIAEKNGIKIENKTIEEYAAKNLNMFDVVVSFQVLEHVTKPNDFIKSKLKSLASGGI
jgi:2-polyprenyl-3-methyl-5-hydroxy-6-metoxy-1,4-benzoquinol methylase